MKILVIGGTGFYGRQIVAALAQVDAASTAIAGRRGPVTLDLADPASFAVMGDYEIIINAADSVSADPVPAAQWCLANGPAWFDIGADAPIAERLLAIPDDGPGAVIVGVGLFPGISSALAVSVAEGGPVDLGIRLSVFSGAGPGIVQLMMRMLTDPSVWWAQGERRVGPPVGPLKRIDYPSAANVKSIRTGLADAPVIHAATGADVAVHLAPKPGVLRVNFRILSWLARALGKARGLVIAPARWSLHLLRAVLLESVPGRVELSATAGDRRRMIAFADGQAATGQAVAAAVQVWDALAEQPSGVRSAGAALPYDAWIAALEALGCALTIGE